MLYETKELKKLENLICADQLGVDDIRRDLLEILESLGLDTLKAVKNLIYYDSREQFKNFTRNLIKDIEKHISENY